MPRGRHRHSQPLHKLLPPSAVAGASVVCAAGAWLLGDPLVLRLLVAAAAAAAVTGAVLMRSWDQGAGRTVAELNRARTADQWKHDERVAELESDLEESRELRTRLDAKLRAKRVELAGLRTEHADLLRRYATAETERASALEGRRVLALEATAPEPKALPAGGSTPTPDAYRRAAEALRNLEARGEHTDEAETTTGAATGPATEAEAKSDAGTVAGTDAESVTETKAPAEAPVEAVAPAEPATAPDAGTAPGSDPAPRPGTAAEPASDEHTKAPAMRHVPAAAAIVPYAARRPVQRPAGGFDYFGTQKAAAAIEAVQHADLADVVGEEVLAAVAQRTPEQRAVGQVIDLTAHDETEQIDVAELRGAVNS
ncbi:MULTISPECIES: hypothetical protein [unclassified Streptomyces]|uniref:hypothetical protein n=1 Tax=unclassified Streptomyces TaxID=2593676 RepID=UPI002E358C0A|nr:hypothetical protein [Streptomyces sp. NBC_01268]